MKLYSSRYITDTGDNDMRELDPRLKQLHKRLEELHRIDDLIQTAELLQEAIAISLEVYGEDHDETLVLYIEYGGTLRNLGRYEEALPYLRKAIAISGRLKGVQHPDYASCLVNLANLLRMMSHHEESEQLFLQARAIYERTIGKKDFLYAGLCNNLGLLYQDMGRYEESIPLHKICLDILKADPRREILYAVTLNNLVEPYRHTGRPEMALQTLQQAIDIFRRYLDRAPVFYAAAINNLGTFYYEEQRYEEALECFRVAVRISREKLGSKSESYQNSMANYKRVDKILSQQRQTTPQTVSGMEEILSKYKNVAYAPSVSQAAGADKPASVHVQTSGRDDRNDCFYEKIIIEKSFSELHTPAIMQAAAPVSATPYADHITEASSGLELAEAYFFDICYPMLVRELPEYLPRMAAGLVGEGSECYGFDDMISRDHDFGPSFQIYIPAEDIPVYGKKLRAEVNKLPTAYAGFGERNTSTYGGGRIGLFSIEDFYDKFLSIHGVPTSNQIWLQMKDYPLSTATNGKVFMDNLGVFTSIRQGLLQHYPKDVQLKKLAAECMQIAQSGQYNFPRSLKREQYVAAYHALDQFIEHYSSAIYLLNKVYKPYYKWEQEGLRRLPVLGMTSWQAMRKLSLMNLREDQDHMIYEIEALCQKLVGVLRSHGLTTSRSDFMLDHGPQILQRITDPALRDSNPWT